MRVSNLGVATVLATFLVCNPGAHAQDGTRVVSGSVGGAVVNDDSSFAFNVSGGVRLAPLFGVEAEFAYMPQQRFRSNERISPQIFPADPRVTPVTDGRTIALLGSVVTGVQFGRVRPYAQVGGGFANVERQVLAGGSVSSTGTAPAQLVTVSDNAPALSAGGGVEIRIWEGVAVGADARYMRLFGTAESADDDHVTRVGVRLGYRF